MGKFVKGFYKSRMGVTIPISLSEIVECKIDGKRWEKLPRR